MTVGELIERLSKYPPTFPVKVEDDEGWDRDVLDIYTSRPDVIISIGDK